MASKLRVWWIPQVPMTPFRVPVASVEEGVKIMDVLALYDLFQLAHNIKPDYSNAGGLDVWNEADRDWESWEDEETGEDDPREYLTAKALAKEKT